MLRFAKVFIFVTAIVVEIDAAIECFQCAYPSADGSSSRECIEHNTTVVSKCDDSTGCMQLSYEDPETGEYDSYFLDCGTTECNSSNSDGVERVEYNSPYRNFTMRKTCCVGDYCNCNSQVCLDAEETHRNAFVETTTITPLPDMVDCFNCLHLPEFGPISVDCTMDSTTQHVQCPGKTCMKLAEQYNNGTSDYIFYTMDCGLGKCTDEMADGVERTSLLDNGTRIEKLTCCRGEYCNCKSQTCLESIGRTTPETTIVETTVAVVETTPDSDNILVTNDVTESNTLSARSSTMVEISTTAHKQTTLAPVPQITTVTLSIPDGVVTTSAATEIAATEESSQSKTPQTTSTEVTTTGSSVAEPTSTAGKQETANPVSQTSATSRSVMESTTKQAVSAEKQSTTQNIRNRNTSPDTTTPDSVQALQASSLLKIISLVLVVFNF